MVQNTVNHGPNIEKNNNNNCSVKVRECSNDGYGYDSVNEKVNSCCFKLDRGYWISVNSSNVGDYFGS